MAVFPTVWYVLHCTTMFALVYLVPQISPALWGQCKNVKIKKMAYLPSLEVGVVTDDWCIIYFTLLFFVYFFLFFVLTLFYRGVQWFISRKSIIFQASRRGGGGGQHFTGGPTSCRGVQLSFPMNTYRTCDFPGGGGPDPLPPPPLFVSACHQMKI